MRYWKVIFWLGALLLPGLALADPQLNPSGLDAWDVYTFGPGQTMSAIMNATALMVSDPVYAMIVRFVAFLGFFVWFVSNTGALAGSKGSGSVLGLAPGFLGQIIALLLVLHFTIGLGGNGGVKSNVIIHAYPEQIDPTGGIYTVQNVPAIIAIPASVLSTFNIALTELVEKNFSIPGASFPDSLKISKGGKVGLAASLLNDAGKVQFTNPYVRQSIATYVQDCTIPMMANGQLDAVALTKSTDAWADMASTSQSLLTTYYSTSNKAGTVVPCASAYTSLSADIDASLPDVLRDASGGWQSDAYLGYVSAALDDSLYWTSGGTGTVNGAGFVKQSAVLKMLQGAYSQAAASTNNSELLLAMNLEQSKQAQTTSWVTSSEIFYSTMGYVYTVLEAFVYALSSIVALLVLAGGGAKMLQGYLSVLLWLALWFPLLAVINFLIDTYLQANLGSMPVSQANMPAISAMTEKLVAAAGYLATLIPVFSYGIIKGTFAFTEFISHGLGSAFATSAAANTSSGNLSMDNQSMGNVNMHKQSYSQKADVGWQASTWNMGLGASMMSADMGGHATAAHGTDQGRKMAEAARSEALARAEGLSSQFSAKQSEADAFSAQQGASIGQAVKTAFSDTLGTNHSVQGGKNWEWRQSGEKQMSDAMRILSDAKYSGTAEHDHAVRQVGEAAIKLSGGDILAAAGFIQGMAGGPIGAAAGGTAGKALGALGADMLKAGYTFQDGEGHTVKNGQTLSASNSKSYDEGYRLATTGSSGKSGSDTYGKTDGRSRTKSAESTAQYQETLSQLQTATLGKEAAESAMTSLNAQRTESLKIAQTVSEGATVAQVEDAMRRLHAMDVPDAPSVHQGMAAVGAKANATLESGKDLGKSTEAAVTAGIAGQHDDVGATAAATTKSVTKDMASQGGAAGAAVASAQKSSLGARTLAADHTATTKGQEGKALDSAKQDYAPTSYETVNVATGEREVGVGKKAAQAAGKVLDPVVGYFNGKK